MPNYPKGTDKVTAAQQFHLAGVMGWPVMHSRSPLMHNYWFAQQGLAGTYVPLAITPDGLEAALRALPALGFSGCNLTIPHKQAALGILDRVDDVGQKIGAVSCVIVEKDGSLSGTNNDWLGFLGNLKQQVPAWRADAGPALVIGAGGGARAICYALMQAGATDIRLVNRTTARAETLARDLGGPITVLPWSARHSACAEVATIVNTTSQGMVGQTALDLDLATLPPSALVSDIIYTPLTSPFLQAAKDRGNQTVNGLGMLLHQGVPAWQRWFGLTPQVTPELVTLMEQSLDPKN